MINDLIFTCKVIGLILVILIGIVLIFAIIKGVIDTIINSRAKRKFADEFAKKMFDLIEKTEEEETKPKKKTTSKKTTKKDSK